MSHATRLPAKTFPRLVVLAAVLVASIWKEDGFLVFDSGDQMERLFMASP